ncbi:MAG: hypothetical protein IT335_00800 [Thermomicrobiales bacterium]|jgi:hypothetical protein|nr:hypothetical protein [Thermomicrobiales bacterium]
MVTSTKTTITFDPDIAQQLKQLAEERDVPLDVVVNDTVRAGLEAPKIVRPPYKVASRPMGLRPGVDLTHALALADELYDEEFERKYREFERTALRPGHEDS